MAHALRSASLSLEITIIFAIPCTDERIPWLLMQHPELDWIRAVIQISAFDLVHPSSISVAILLQ